MPVVAAPASPFNARAAAATGDTVDRINQQRLLEQEAFRRNYVQASIATAQNQTSAQNNDNDNEAALIQQRAQIDFQRQAQLRQFEAARQEQMRRQQFEMDRMNVAISTQEQQQQVQRINGLAEIESQVREGILTKEQAGDARYELLTGINAFQRRYQMQQAQLDKAREAKLLSDSAINEAVLSQNMNIRAKEANNLERIVLDPQMELSVRRELQPKFQALAAAIGPGAAKAAIDAEVRDTVTERGGAIKEVLDGISADGTNKYRAIPPSGQDAKAAEMEEKNFERELRHFETAHKAWQANVDRYYSALEKQEQVVRKQLENVPNLTRETINENAKADLAVRGYPIPGPEPVMPTRQPKSRPESVPTQQVQQSSSAPQPVQRVDDKASKAIESSKLNPAQEQAAKAINGQIQAIMSKPKKDITQADVAELERLTAELEKYLK